VTELAAPGIVAEPAAPDIHADHDQNTEDGRIALR
jgi:hypothetical protein